MQVLLDNAVSYSSQGGRVVLSVSNEGKFGRLAVRDSGIGISSEELSRIFSQFYRGGEARRVDTEGMGIGLSIAQSIAKRQNGKITVASEGLGKGSTFSLYLPKEKK